MKDNDEVQIPEDVVAAEVDGAVVLLRAGAGNYYGLDELGTFIWRRIENHLSLSDICSDIQEEYSISSSDAEKDVRAFCQDLVDNGLLFRPA